MARPSEAERLRDCRLVFERAQADGISLAVARHQIMIEKWEAAARRLQHCRQTTAQPVYEQCRSPARAYRDESNDGLAWWHR